MRPTRRKTASRPDNEGELTLGELATLAGVAPSALHFYEAKGLIPAYRSAGNQRRYHESVLRRVWFIRTAHAAGIPLAEVGEALSGLPVDRPPADADWQIVSELWGPKIQDRIDQLTRLRDDPDGCIEDWLRAAGDLEKSAPVTPAGGRG